MELHMNYRMEMMMVHYMMHNIRMVMVHIVMVQTVVGHCMVLDMVRQTKSLNNNCQIHHRLEELDKMVSYELDSNPRKSMGYHFQITKQDIHKMEASGNHFHKIETLGINFRLMDNDNYFQKMAKSNHFNIVAFNIQNHSPFNWRSYAYPNMKDHIHKNFEDYLGKTLAFTGKAIKILILTSFS